jgi:hypothetical protein
MILKLLFAPPTSQLPSSPSISATVPGISPPAAYGPHPVAQPDAPADPKAEPGIRQTAYPLGVATTLRCRAQTAAAAYQVQRLTDQP